MVTHSHVFIEQHGGASGPEEGEMRVPFPSLSPLPFLSALGHSVHPVTPSGHCPGPLWTLRTNGTTHVSTKPTWQYLPDSFPTVAVTNHDKFSG